LTPLSVALGKNHKKIADYLLSLPSTDINCKDDKGRTLIANEVLRKKINIENLNSLLQKKADINLSDLQGQTPLHHAACRSDSSDIIKLLLSKNVDVNITDKNGLNAFMSAINSGNYENAKLILYHPLFDLK
jgi:ankyrin repeat protein